MNISWLWSIQYFVFVFFAFITTILALSVKIFSFDKDLNKVLLVYLIVAIISTIRHPYFSLFIVIQNFARTSVIIGVIYLKNQYKKALLDWFVNVFTIILLISIPAWLLYLSGLPFTHGPLVDIGDGFHYLYNYKFFIIGELSLGLTPRFASVFLEPGWVGTMCCFVLFSTQFNRNKLSTYLCLIGLLLSFSLSAIVNLLVCSLMWIILNSNHKLLYLSIAFVIVGIFFWFATSYRNGNNVLNETIVERLAFDEDLGIVGNNRTNDLFDSAYEDLLNSSDKWFGIGNEVDADFMYSNDWYNHSSGIRKDILDNGLIGTGLYLLLLFLLLFRYKGKRSFVFMVCFLMASFIRNLWRCDFYLIIYIVSLCCLSTSGSSRKTSVTNGTILKAKNNKRYSMERC